MEQFYTNEQKETEVIETQPARKTKNGKVGTVAALIAAVMVVGAGAGVGGAVIAANTLKTDKIATTVPSDTSISSNGESQHITDGGSSNVNGDVSSALNAISSSNDLTPQGGLVPTTVTPSGSNGEYTSAELYQAVNDTVVLIKVYKKSSSAYSDYYYDYYFGYGGRDEKEKSDEDIYAGYGSGVVFTDDGYILTNAHVVDESSKLVVVVNDYNDPEVTHEYEATVIGSDTSTDIAVIKIERDEKFKCAKIGNSDTLKVGQEVCAIGNPGVNSKVVFTHTMTKGIISGLNVVCLNDNGYSLSLIQTDAAINSGNSGGGLFDMYGNVIGVVNSKIIVDTYEGIGFALTINEAKPIMEDLLSYGYVKSRPVLGVTTIELNEYRAQLYGVRISQGLLISDMREDAPVSKSGLRVSDVITKINGENVSSVTDVQAIISKFRVGDKVTATVARTNEEGGMDSVEIEIELTESGN